MKSKIILRLLLVIAILTLILRLSVNVFIEPWLVKKIQKSFNEKYQSYTLSISKIDIFMLSPGIELKNITIQSNQDFSGNGSFQAVVASVKIKGIRIAKAVFRKEITIRDVSIFNPVFKGEIPFPGKENPPVISNKSIQVNRTCIDKIDLAVSNISDAQSISIKQGILNLYNINVEKMDTLSLGVINQFDFEAEELGLVSADSMYSHTALDIRYDTLINSLVVKSFSVKPNFSDQNFMDRHEYQTDRFDGDFSKLIIHKVNLADYFKSRQLKCSFVDIGKMELNVFRDQRKEFRHSIKPAFQEILYGFPGTIHIDSLGITSGNVTYREHAPEANEAGSLRFFKMDAKMYNIFNDPIYKTESKFLELKAHASLMGKGNLQVHLKGKLYDKENSFSLTGTLSNFEIRDLNPYLEKNAFIYATSGKIETMNFDFIADNTKATGQIIILYEGLDIALKNKQTDDTTGIKERFISYLANRYIIDSNPVAGEDVRVGIIDRERDPERSVFNYAAKSIISGIKGSITKGSGKSKNSKSRLHLN